MNPETAITLIGVGSMVLGMLLVIVGAVMMYQRVRRRG